MRCILHAAATTLEETDCQSLGATLSKSSGGITNVLVERAQGPYFDDPTSGGYTYVGFLSICLVGFRAEEGGIYAHL